MQQTKNILFIDKHTGINTAQMHSMSIHSTMRLLAVLVCSLLLSSSCGLAQQLAADILSAGLAACVPESYGVCDDTQDLFCDGNEWIIRGRCATLCLSFVVSGIRVDRGGGVRAAKSKFMHLMSHHSAL